MFSSGTTRKLPRNSKLDRATTPVIETLELRQLMSASTVQPTPFFLDFGSNRGEVLDKDGQGTGFTRVQANKLGNEYQAALIDLDTALGVLKITSTGNSTAGSNTNGDNTLTNALETQFNATTSGFKITTRLVGPLSYINTPSEQAGITFGPDQDNFIKLVAISQPTGTFIQFTDEQSTNGTTFTHSVDLKTAVSNFANVNTLDLQLVGDAATGVVTAYYATNGGAWVKMSKTITLSGASKSAFFNSAGRAGLLAAHKNDVGPETFVFDSFRIDGGTITNARPNVTATRPGAGDVGIGRNAFIAADVKLPTPGAGIDVNTLTSANVKLYRSSDKLPINLVLNTSGAGDAIVATPTGLLDPNTTYTFEITAGLKDTVGEAFQPYTMTFATGTTGGDADPSLAFEKINLPTAQGHSYTSVVVGPDGKLYAGTDGGLIQRFAINSDGTLGAAQNITSLINAEGGPRLVTGMAFDPASTASDLILWVSHSDGALVNASDFSGKITKLSGSNLQNVQHAVINLPRAIRDHATNQPVFGPDGALYFNQPSMSDMGAPDNAWGLRSEHLLSGAILRLDTTLVGETPIDVKTDSGGTYNPFAVGAPLTIYATGVRNAYDMVWTADGRLYAPVSGAAAGGNSPSTPGGSYSFGPEQRIDASWMGPYTGPNVPGLGAIAETQNDYLYGILNAGYYGQPNPVRGEFVLNGGNPTAGLDDYEVVTYPVGTEADRNYRAPMYTFGKSYSPSGIVEYAGSAFGGALNGKLLVTRFGGGDDVIVLTRGAGGKIVADNSGIAGLSGFVDPRDLVENNATGFLYIAEYGGQRITLARPIAAGANLTPSKPAMYFNDHTASGASSGQILTIKNTGSAALTLPTDAFSLNGADAARFSISNKPTLPLTLAPGQSVTVTLTFTANAIGIKTANLQIKSSDPDSPIMQLPLRGLGTAGTGGANEPSLQRVFDLYQLPINVGDSNPLDVYLDDPPQSPNDEIIASLLKKAGNGPVTIEPLASFGVGHSSTPTTRFGYYTPGNRFDRTELFTITGTTSSQSVNPNLSGTTSFDPGSKSFGLYSQWPSMYPSVVSTPGGTEVYSEDRLNEAFDSDSPRKARFYQLKTADGAEVPNAYVMAWEEFNGGYDNQDFVAIIRNVQPVAAGPEIGFENLDNLSFTDRLVFNRVQIQPPDTKIDPLTGETIQPPNNVVHDIATLRVRNTGTQSLDITSMTISSGWTIQNAPTVPISIPAGGYIDLTVKFTATGSSGGKFLNGSLILHSNDSDEETSTIQLCGFWQYKSEKPEPTLQEIVNLFGYSSVINKAGEILNEGGKISRIGDEVLSSYWRKADSTQNVVIRQLAAYHTQGNTAFVRYFVQNTNGSVTQTNLFTHDGLEGQSILPHITNSLTSPAQASFTNNNAFGFRIDSEWSDPTRNAPPPENPSDQGHHVRFWVARDRDGKIIPNTYLMAMDYAGINYDYNDNVYLVSNIKPETPPSAPTGVAATSGGAGTMLTWTANKEPNIKGYNVYRSDAIDGTYVKINEILLTTADFNDVNAPVGVTAHYQIRAVDLNGGESSPAAIDAVRPSDITPPATPANFFATGSNSGIALDWANNTDLDLAGYRVYRASSFGGVYELLNPEALLTSSDFFDSAAAPGVTSYYRVTAVDTSGNESAANTANAQRTVVDVTPPASPAGVTATGSLSSIALDWDDNGEIDLAGYNVYRSTSQFGTYTKLNSGLLTLSQLVDTTATAGVKSWYRITAVDANGNESTATTTSATRVPDTTAPAIPTGAIASGSVSGIALDWNDNTDTDFGGYNVYRSDSATGTFVKINGAPLTASQFVDATAPQSVASYYRITAVDTSGNQSGYDTATAVRPDSIAPAAPTGVSSTATFSGITVWWLPNSETDVAGYNVYRSTAPDGIFTRVNASMLTQRTFDDAAAPAGVASYYRVTAVDQFGNESAPATTAAFRPNVGANGGANDMAYDWKGFLHFAYYDTVTKQLKYAMRTSQGWGALQTVDTSGDDVGSHLSLAVDGNRKPAIAYFDATKGDLRYAELVNGTWQVTTIDSQHTTGQFPSLKFNKRNRPAIAFYKPTSGDLRMAEFSGTAWTVTDVATVRDVGRSASLAMQPNGLWAIAYEAISNKQMHYAYQTSATTWAAQVVDTTTLGIEHISLAFDTSGRASVSYQETGLGDLKYAVLKSGKWAAGTVASVGVVGAYSKLVFGSDGRANIFYYDQTMNRLMHVKGYSGNWSSTIVETAGGKFATAVLGTNTKITYAWLDTASNVLTLDEL